MSHQSHARTSRAGLIFGVTCYMVWGLFPLYVAQLEFASALEIVAHRIVWSLLLCLGLLALTRRLPEFVAVLRSPRQFGALALAAALIACNWLTYVYAATTGQVLQASLGYFINPLLTVMLGVLVLRERLRPAQWLAVSIGLVAIVVIAVGQGRPPWLALALAFSFGFYGLSKKLAGRSVGPIPSLTVETLVLAPLALLALAWLNSRGQTHFAVHGANSALLLMSTGIATTLPLITFAAAARRLPLSTLGLLQYIGPSLQFLIAVAIAHEPMSPSRWTGFAMIWTALLMVSLDALHTQRRRRRQAAANAPELEPLG
ncbi:MAG: EamA family transporter RarD [Xanthomonadaceae bacterium]|nr:EamA family transporter RarD [Xanthomonadaceae bacterium]